MTDYVFAYHGGNKPETPEAGAEMMTNWRAWTAGLGDAFVNLGAAVGMSKTVSSGGVTDDGGSNPLSGYSVVTADSMDAAIEMAQGCPHLDFGGTIEVAPVMDMEM